MGKSLKFPSKQFTEYEQTMKYLVQILILASLISCNQTNHQIECMEIRPIGSYDLRPSTLVLTTSNRYCFATIEVLTDTLDFKSFQVKPLTLNQLGEYLANNKIEEKPNIDGRFGYRIMIASSEGKEVLEDFVLKKESYELFRKNLMSILKKDSELGKENLEVVDRTLLPYFP